MWGAITAPTHLVACKQPQAQPRALEKKRDNMSEYQTAAYRKARAELLADNPLCHWCRKARATELDHLNETDNGGSIQDGYVPACKPCNSRRGAQYINGNRTAAAHARAEHLGLDPTQKPKTKPKEPELFLKTEKIMTRTFRKTKIKGGCRENEESTNR